MLAENDFNNHQTHQLLISRSFLIHEHGDISLHAILLLKSASKLDEVELLFKNLCHILNHFFDLFVEY